MLSKRVPMKVMMASLALGEIPSVPERPRPRKGPRKGLQPEAVEQREHCLVNGPSFRGAPCIHWICTASLRLRTILQ
jgi:hypothetical protein